MTSGELTAMEDIIVDLAQNAVQLCQDDPDANTVIVILSVWFVTVVLLNLGMITFTAYQAKKISKEIYNIEESDLEDFDPEMEDDDNVDLSMYQVLPENMNKKRNSDLSAIEEADCEDKSENDSDSTDTAFSDEEKDYFPSSGGPPSASSSMSIASYHTSHSVDLPPIPPRAFLTAKTTGGTYGRSNSTHDCLPSRNSLGSSRALGLTKNSLKRTESQNRADYLLRVKML